MKHFIQFPDSVLAFFLFQFRKNPGSLFVKRQIVYLVNSSGIYIHSLVLNLCLFQHIFHLFGVFHILFSLAFLDWQTSESETYLTHVPPSFPGWPNKNLVAQLDDLFRID